MTFRILVDGSEELTQRRRERLYGELLHLPREPPPDIPKPPFSVHRIAEVSEPFGDKLTERCEFVCRPAAFNPPSLLEVVEYASDG